MKHRSRLAWLGALALILALPPVASSVVGDLGAASQSSERRQNGRLDRHGLRLSKHGRQITRLKAAEYGVARGLITTASGSVYLMTLTTPKIPTDGNQAMASGSVPFASAGGEQLTLRGVVRSNRPSGTGRAAGMLTVVCAPMGTGTCAGGTVGAGETVCKITANYDSSTGVLTLVGVRKVGLNDTSAPTASDTNIAGGTCTLPPGGGDYTVAYTVVNEYGQS